MNKYTYYHNVRCSKSNAGLAILAEHNITPIIINYLETPPDTQTLQSILKKLGISARELLRTGESEYKELNLANEKLTEADLIEAMIKHPKLIERPILVVGEQAVIGRPPEKILALLD